MVVFLCSLENFIIAAAVFVAFELGECQDAGVMQFFILHFFVQIHGVVDFEGA